jgi:D-alanyl-D-alanine carboxypeptidase
MKSKLYAFVLTVLYLLKTASINSYAEELTTPPTMPPPPELFSQSVTLMDADTGIVLYEHVQDALQHPASVTKVMTALITLENCKPDDRIAFSREAVYSLPEDATHIGMDEGETLSVKDALYGLLLESANEVANALAEHIAGSNAAFAELMNARAKAIGAVNTHFTNPSGLHDNEHKTTSYDMALIMREAIRNETFKEIINTRRYDIAPTERKPETRLLRNKNELIQNGNYFNEWVVGGKTGFTTESGHTFVNYAQKDGRSLIVSVMFGGKYEVYDDTLAMLDYGFGLPYAEHTVLDADGYLLTLPVHGEIAGQMHTLGEAVVKPDESITFNLPEGFDGEEFNYDTKLPSKLAAPVNEGDTAGTLVCYIQNIKVGEVPLKAVNSIYLPEVAVPPLREETPPEETLANKTPAGIDAADEVIEVFDQGAEPVAQMNDTDIIDDTDLIDNTAEIEAFNILEILKAFAVPIGLLLLVLLVSLITFVKRRKKRSGGIDFDKYGSFKYR